MERSVLASLLASSLLLCNMSASNAAEAALKPIVDLRVRSETVDQDGLPNEANALVLRARLGFETAKFASTSLLAEGEFLWVPRGDYRPDPLVATRTSFPVIADRETHELNRLHLTNTSLPGTTLTLGRQRINLDDHRFVGSVPWRMNEQTFDGLRMVNKSLKNLTVDLSYVNQANRVFGRESPQSPYEGDNFFGNVGYQFKPGKLTAFTYLVDIDPIPGIPAAVRDSSATYGARFAGETPIGKSRLTYLGSYATQTDHAGNPLAFDLDSYVAELGGITGRFNYGVGYEVLEGNGTKGFTTPYATLHKFQGWADKFLTTPVNGIEDLYFTLGWSTKKLGPFDAVAFTAAWHEFDAERVSQHYGSELNLQLTAKWKKFAGLLKYADYRADRLMTDTHKLWVQLEYAL